MSQAQLFANINEVLLANDAFWTKHLRPILRYTRQTRELVKPSQMLASFNQVRLLSIKCVRCDYVVLYAIMW